MVMFYTVVRLVTNLALMLLLLLCLCCSGFRSAEPD